MKRFKSYLKLSEKEKPWEDIWKSIDIHMDALIEEMEKWWQPMPGTKILGTQWSRKVTPYTSDGWCVDLEVLYEYEEPEVRQLGEIPL